MYTQAKSCINALCPHQYCFHWAGTGECHEGRMTQSATAFSERGSGSEVPLGSSGLTQGPRDPARVLSLCTRGSSGLTQGPRSYLCAQGGLTQGPSPGLISVHAGVVWSDPGTQVLSLCTRGSDPGTQPGSYLCARGGRLV